jgi:hypothetical protein
MIDSVNTPKLTYLVVILEFEEKMPNIDGTSTILNENISDQGNKTNGKIKKNYKRAAISKSLH